MKLFHRHNWSKWSEPKLSTWSEIDRLTGKDYGDQNGYIQDRTCETCGKYDWRRV